MEAARTTPPARKPFSAQQIAEKLVSMLPGFARANATISLPYDGDTSVRVIRATWLYREIEVAITECGIDTRAKRGGQGQPLSQASWGLWDTIPQGFTMREIVVHLENQLVY